MPTMDPAIFSQLLQQAAAGEGGAPSPQAPEQTAHPVGEASAAPAPVPGEGAASTSGVSKMDPAGKVGAAIVSGAAQAAFETKDFLFGQPAESDKSGARKYLEQTGKDVQKEGIGYGLVQSISQFATGMLGAGKLIGAAKVVPGVAGMAGMVGRGAAVGAEAVGSAAGAVAGSAELGAAGARAVAKAAPEALKAAGVGAVAFDPHSDRLSNLIEQYPSLSNPVNRYLAAKPGDSAAEGRLKNALESLGMDAALLGVFAASTKLYKAIRTGDQAEIKAASREVHDAESGRTSSEDSVANRLDPQHPEFDPDSVAAEALKDRNPGLWTQARPEDYTPEAWLQEYHDTVAHQDAEAITGGLKGRHQSILNTFTSDPFMFQGSVDRPQNSNISPRAAEALDGAAKSADVPGGSEGLAWLRDKLVKFDQTGDAPGELDRIVKMFPREHQFQVRRTLLDEEAHQGAHPAGDLWDLYLSDKPDLRSAMELARGEAQGADLPRFDPAKPDAAGALRDRHYMDTGEQNQRVLEAANGEAPAGAAGATPGGPLQVTVRPSNMEQAFGPATPGTPTWDKQPNISVEQVGTATQAGAPPRQPQLIELGKGENTQSFVEAMKADKEAFERYGSWQDAVDDGYQFGKGGNVPWQKMVGHRLDDGVDAAAGKAAPQSQLDALISMTMEADPKGFDRAKGGRVLTDSRVATLARNWHNAYDLDPAETAAALQRAGKEARTLVAKMEAAFTLSQRAFLDTQRIASEIELGQLGRWGTEESARDAMAAAHQMGADLLASALSMRAAAGRGVRRNQAQFGATAEGLNALRQMDPGMYAQLVKSTGGDPKAMRQLATLGGSTVKDWVQFLYVNSLLWGPKTHAINTITNTYMAMARPLERIIGSYAVGGTAGADIRMAAFKQYAYMTSSFTDSFRNAVEAWRLGDSVLTPHMQEANTLGSNMTLQVSQMPFRPTNGLGDLGYNGLLAVAKLTGVPTRLLGSMDELMKGTTYRSVVIGNSFVEGAQRGLKDQDLRDFVSKSLRDAFDDQGRAINGAAIQEARTATFQQDLLPGTFGKTVSTNVANHPMLRFILPFVRTPTNVLRMGWKMTPILNMAQTEFRQAISGKLGEVQQAQAVGQMMMGTMLFGAAGSLMAQGKITGGGPTDPKLKQQAMATGWRPYSIVSENKDGSKTYAPFNWADPVALPFGVMADIWDIAHSDYSGDGAGWSQKAADTSEALFVGLVKNLANKSYLISLQKFLDAAASGMEADPGEKGTRFIGSIAGGLTPFSAGLRFANQSVGDPYLREARRITDYVKQNVPGLSASLPARYDTWGDPVTVHPGFWLTGSNALVDQEVTRMVMEESTGFGAPSPSVRGVDLRDITLKDGRQAYEAYQQLAKAPTKGVMPMKERAAKVMETAAYRRAPDGDVGTAGTKQWMVYKVISQYRQAALKQIEADPNVRTELMKKQQAVATAYQNQKKQAQNPSGAALGAISEAFGIQ